MTNTVRSRQRRAPRAQTSAPRVRAGFTLIEILAVVAIIGMLAAILVPIIGTVLEKSKKTVSQGRFSQWATGVAQYKQAHGYYPPLTSSNSAGEKDVHYNLGQEETVKNFVRCLSGKNVDGSALSESEGRDYNFKRQSFCNFDAEAFRNKDPKTNKLVDYLDNDKIHLIFDTTDDGVLDLDTGELPDSEQELGVQDGRKLTARIFIYTIGKEGPSGSTQNIWVKQ